MVKLDPNVLAHLEWLGYVQPTGLVVSAPALVRVGAILNTKDVEGQKHLRGLTETRTTAADDDEQPFLPDFAEFSRTVLGWNHQPRFYAGVIGSPIPEELEVALPDYGETLRPDIAVASREPKDGEPNWQLLVRVLDTGQDLDKVVRGSGHLEASPHGRLERLLRQTGVPAGLLFNGHTIRLLSAPRGESSGWLDFEVADMVTTPGRSICAAMRLLLGQQRLLAGARESRLLALLADSRKFQNEVSERLAEQVLHALYELLRGFQHAHDHSGQELLREVLAEHPDQVYRSLLTVLLRLVFLLYAEERDMLPQDTAYEQHYSLAGLYERLREDAALFPDTMDQRYGAWAQLLVLFRMIHDGATLRDTVLPARHGVLFDPDRYPFLEGRPMAARQIFERIEVPLVPDGTIYRALEKLLILDGERISYRALDVEQIGSVYETMMGFRLETATGPSLAIRAAKKHGAPTTIDLSSLLDTAPAKRKKWLQDATDRKITKTVETPVKAATTIDDLHAALEKVIDRGATPDLVPQGAMVLQPSEERRRSGSHYTPRELTAPIVRTTLEPVLARLAGGDGETPRPEAILELKVCDPAMGSGAFLVETCRHLGDVLVDAWRVHGGRPELPPDEDEVVFARRLVAQRCLYGVDRNPVAVDLAKMSLWLVTLARDHALTFVDHALRHGDSLVGLSRRQIEAFHWAPDAPRYEVGLEALKVRAHLETVADLRERIRTAKDAASDAGLRDLWEETELELETVQTIGDAVILAFFEGNNAKAREAKRHEFADELLSEQIRPWRSELDRRRAADPPLAPFHWEIEFPEVFGQENPGFDAFVGNPPFVGGRRVRSSHGDAYFDWLGVIHRASSGNADLVAHFFRRAFDLLRETGTFGLIATNTIGQGDTRSSGLSWICTNGGEIYHAQRRVKWPGMAAVVVSVVHIVKGEFDGPRVLDDRAVETVTAFLFHGGGHDDPKRLVANAGKSFVGSYVLGMGFTFDDTDTRGTATSIAEMRRLIEKDPKNQEVIFPYIGGEEVNSDPTHAHHRYAIDFRNRSEAECRRDWPHLMNIVEQRVKPERKRRKSDGSFALREPLPTRWWHHADKRPALYAAIAEQKRVLVIPQTSNVQAPAFLPTGMVYGHTLIVFPLTTYSAYTCLQARSHQVWAAFLGPTMKDDLRYTPSDCFETYPFPEDWESRPDLEAVGKEYYEFRADLMVRNDEGLTKTYNRFHDPEDNDPDIVKLRELHARMDRAVLDAYGWTDIPTDCEFILDYEIDEETWGKRKKPYRYRWPDDVRDEVLARLLELNAQRAAEEERQGLTTKGRKAKKKASKTRSSKKTTKQDNEIGDLFA